jgi:2,3-bisphosphoglycerate-dependent phosphoglycerate mutase
MRLYFVRHGESEANVLQIISNRGYKHGLTDRGRQQALTLAQTLQDANIARIYASPLMRAVQTAEILADAWGVDYSTTPALREFDCGVIEDKDDPASWMVWRNVWEDWFQRQKWDSCADGGESFLDIKARFVPFVDSLIAEYGQTGEHLLLVGHGGLFISMLPLVLTNVEPAFAHAHHMTNTGYVVADLRTEGLVCTEWCQTTVSTS